MTKEHDLDISPIINAPFAVSPFDDIADGPGLHVAIGEGTCQIFPTTRIVRAELAGNRVRMQNLTRVAVEDEGLQAYAETDNHHTALRMDAASMVVVTSRKGDVSPAIPATQEVASTLLAASSDTGRPAAEELSEGPGGDDGERERVNVTGRIGHKPHFRTTPKGTMVGSFSLAVHSAPGETTWHKIVTFGSRAQKLQDTGLGKGDEVEIVGYPHERERLDQKTGETKTITEIYAAVVKKPKDKE